MNAELIGTCEFSQLSFVQFRPYATSFPRFLLSLTLMPKRPWSSLDLTLSFKNSLDAKIEGLVLNVDYLENRRRKFMQKKYGRKRHWLTNKFRSLDSNFSFCMDFLHRWWLLKVKKRRLFLSSLNSLYYFFIFWFKGLSFKTHLRWNFDFR